MKFHNEVPVREHALYTAFTTESLKYFMVHECVTIAVDIYRASTTITAILHYNQDLPVRFVFSIQEALKMKSDSGTILCGEWKARSVDGFDLNNSPCEVDRIPEGTEQVIFFSTNMSRLIQELQQRQAKKIYIGSFWNFSAIVGLIRSLSEPVLIACAGWRGHPAIEDILFAGAVVDALKCSKWLYPDEPYIAMALWELAKKEGLESFIRKRATHVKRLEDNNAHEDIRICLKRDVTSIIPVVERSEVKHKVWAFADRA